MCAARVELPDLAAVVQQRSGNNNPLRVYLSRENDDNKNNAPVSLDQAFATFTSALEKEYKKLELQFAEKEAKKTDEEKQREKEQLEAANAQKQKQGNANNENRNFQRKEDSLDFLKSKRVQSFFLEFESLQAVEEFIVRRSPCDEFNKKSIVVPIGHSSATKFAYALCRCPQTFTFMSKNFDFKFDLLTFDRNQDLSEAVARFHSVDELWRCYQMFEHKYEAHPVLEGKFFNQRLNFKNEFCYPSHHSNNNNSNNNNNNGDAANTNAADASATDDSLTVSGEKIVFAFDDHKTRSKEQAYSCFANPKNKDEVILRAFYACALPKETDLKLSDKKPAPATPELDFISGVSSVPAENHLLETYNKQFSTASNRFDRKFSEGYSFSKCHRQATAAARKEANKPNNRPAVVFETVFDAKSFEEIVASRRFYYQEDVVMTHELSFEERDCFKDAKIDILANSQPPCSAEAANQHLQKLTSLAPALIETLNLVWEISLKNSEDDVATPKRPSKLFTTNNHLTAEFDSNRATGLLLRNRFNLPKPETNANIGPAGARHFGSIADHFAERALTEIIGAALKVVPVRMTVVDQKCEQASAKLWNSVVSNGAIFNLFGAGDKELLKKAIKMASGSNGVCKKQGAAVANAAANNNSTTAGVSHIVAECFARSLNRSDNLSKEGFYKLLNFAGVITDDVLAALVETDDPATSSSQIKVLLPDEVYKNAKETSAKVQLLRNTKRVDFQKKSRPHPFTTAEQMEIYMGKDTTGPAYQLTRDQIEGFKKIAATNTFASDVLKPLASFAANAGAGDSFKHLSNQLEIHAGLRSHFSNLSQAIVLTLINRSGTTVAGSPTKSLEVAKFVADFATKKVSPFSDKEQEAFACHVVACFGKHKDAKREEQKHDNLLASATVGLLHPSSKSLANFDQFLQGFVINTVASSNNKEHKLLRVYVPEVKQVYEYPLTSQALVSKFANFTLGSEIQVQFRFFNLDHRAVDDILQQQQQQPRQNNNNDKDAPEWKVLGDPTVDVNKNKFRVSDPKTNLCRDVVVSVRAAPPCHRCVGKHFAPQMIEAIRQHYDCLHMDKNFCDVENHRNNNNNNNNNDDDNKNTNNNNNNDDDNNNNDGNYRGNQRRYQNGNNTNNNNNYQGGQVNNNNNNNNYNGQQRSYYNNNNNNGQQRSYYNNNNNNGQQRSYYNNNNNNNGQQRSYYNNNNNNNGEQRSYYNNNNNYNGQQRNNNNNFQNNNDNQQQQNNDNNNGNAVRTSNNQPTSAGVFAWGQVAFGNKQKKKKSQEK